MLGYALFFFIIVPLVVLWMVVWLGVLCFSSFPKRVSGAMVAAPVALIGAFWLYRDITTSGLYDAGCRGNSFGIRWRMALGANPNGSSLEDAGPLYCAVENDRLETVRFLLERGADPDLAHEGEESYRYDTARQMAKENGSPEINALLAKYPKR